MTPTPPAPCRPSWAIVISLGLLIVALITFLISQRLGFQQQLAEARQQLAAQARPRDPVVHPPPSPQEVADLMRRLQLNQPSPSGVSVDKSIRERAPDAAAAHRRLLVRSVQRLQGPMVDSLNLPPDTAFKLRNLIVDRRMAVDDARAAARQEGVHDRATVEKAEAVATEEVDAKIAALLGPDGSQSLQRRLAVADEVNQLQSFVALDMSFAGVPLSPDQTVALAEAAKALHYSTLPSASGARLTEMANPGVNVHEVILEKAAAILSPVQLAIFRADQEEKRHEEALRVAEVQSMKRTPPRPGN